MEGVVAFSLVVCGLLILEGFYELITGKRTTLGGGKQDKKYTKESLEKYHRVSGILLIAAACGLALARCQCLVIDEIVWLRNLGLGIIIGAVVLMLAFWFIIVKQEKKDDDEDQGIR